MSSFLDKAKEKAQHLANQVKDKVDDVQDRRKADDLLDDIGRIVYRQHTEGTQADDATRIDELVAKLKVLEETGTPILDDKSDRGQADKLPPPATPSDLPPPTA
ncbi:MAG: hypothetical protein WCC60_04840 [Ilumatobacteraceae bacterium]